MLTKKLNPVYLNGPDGKPAFVILTFQEFDDIVEDLELLEDSEIAAAYHALPDDQKDLIPFEQAAEDIEFNKISLACGNKSFAKDWPDSTEEDEYWNSLAKKQIPGSNHQQG